MHLHTDILIWYTVRAPWVSSVSLSSLDVRLWGHFKGKAWGIIQTFDTIIHFLRQRRKWISFISVCWIYGQIMTVGALRGVMCWTIFWLVAETFLEPQLVAWQLFPAEKQKHLVKLWIFSSGWRLWTIPTNNRYRANYWTLEVLVVFVLTGCWLQIYTWADMLHTCCTRHKYYLCPPPPKKTFLQLYVDKKKPIRLNMFCFKYFMIKLWVDDG